jgi:hypothetical protein
MLQGLVINNFQISELLYPMAYIIAIIMLPVEISIYMLLVLALILGVSVDALSDTFGLHTSSCLTIAYTRPMVLNLIKPRDGYDSNLMLSIHDMGKTWFLTYSFLIIIIHHLWFFTFEMLKFELIGTIILKTLISAIFSLMLIVLLQYLLFKPSKV